MFGSLSAITLLCLAGVILIVWFCFPLVVNSRINPSGSKIRAVFIIVSYLFVLAGAVILVIFGLFVYAILMIAA
ncbi:MAG: hypothetical protein MK108_14635 [Mariniblastus sp.]|nr:hypothetical protein [Mariniblastus sp.]